MSTELPALPEPMKDYPDHGEDTYTADQMHAYAAAAVAAEREQCAKLCDGVAYSHANTAMLGPEQNALKCAAAIRGQDQKEQA